ncbi:LytR/AlgR family response regulator transcription factor [Myroides sp. LJL119]
MSQVVLKCLVVDDEPLARRAIINFIGKIDFLQATKSCSSALEAQEILQANEFDLIFLDINMPYLSGIDFLESISSAPMVIFTTAHCEYALQGYRLQVVDYLLKPIDFKRFFQAASKAKELFLLKQSKLQAPLSNENSMMYVKQEDGYLKVDWQTLLYIQAMQNYLKLIFANKVLVIHQTMIAIEDILPKAHFFRIHKSYLVNINHIDALQGSQVVVNATKLPISRTRKEALLKQVVHKKLLSK